ncbi:hypothetical protein J1605_020295 [Eschrichtius robustus]|uniref:Pro-MCH n=1 Tax=Eschrichtius robustus TaxID=9764 RepID=A0AB34HHI0_ESCRO|nr:hypothetical protein J1605_020295 [Eschrichtius robustus]
MESGFRGIAGLTAAPSQPGEPTGVSPSASKSIRNLEDDMVFKTLRLGKAFQKEDTEEKSIVVPSLEEYKNDESNFMNDEENKNSKCSGVCWEESIDLAGKSDTCWSTSSFQKKTKSFNCLWGKMPLMLL